MPSPSLHPHRGGVPLGDNVYLNRDRTAVVSEFAAGKKWQVPRAEAARMGLLDSEEKPVQKRRTEPTLQRTVEEVGPTAPQKRRTSRKKK